jgi:hypothetical protein
MRPDLATVPPFYRAYVEKVRDHDLLDALRSTDRELQALVRAIPEEKGDFRYSDGKWTIKEVLNHIMDSERVFAYRALRFSRSDGTPLQPFEENDYAGRANAGGRTVSQLGAELHRLRETTIDLFSSFTPEMLMLEGIASGKTISVLNLGYIIAGHGVHHLKIVAERYLNR